jgi:hypothetical protein
MRSAARRERSHTDLKRRKKGGRHDDGGGTPRDRHEHGIGVDGRQPAGSGERLPAAAAVTRPVRAARQFPGGGPGGMGGVQQELKLLKQFDADGDKRLKRCGTQSRTRSTSKRKVSRAVDASAAAACRARLRLAPKSRATVRRNSARNVPFYDAGTLRTLFLDFENADWEAEIIAFNNSDVEVPATLEVDGKVYKDVGVHARGMSSFMSVPDGYKHSLNLSIDWIHEAQSVYGYRTLNLLNSHEDPTLLRTVLFMQAAREYVPAPKANFVRVVINGESWGVYRNAEQYNKDLINEWFKTTDGARWKVPGSPGRPRRSRVPRRRSRAVQAHLRDQEQGRSEGVGRARQDDEGAERDAARAARGCPRAAARRRRRAQVPRARGRARQQRRLLGSRQRLQHLSRPHGQVPRLPARRERDICDGHAGRRTGTRRARRAWRARWLWRSASGRIPDASGWSGGPGGRRGGGGRMMGGDANLDVLIGLDDPSKPLRSKLLAVPALRAKYLGYAKTIANRWLDWTVLEPIVTKYHALIAADVKSDTRKLNSFEEFQSGVEDLKAFAARRRAVVLEQASR